MILVEKLSSYFFMKILINMLDGIYNAKQEIFLTRGKNVMGVGTNHALFNF